MIRCDKACNLMPVDCSHNLFFGLQNHSTAVELFMSNWQQLSKSICPRGNDLKDYVTVVYWKGKPSKNASGKDKNPKLTMFTIIPR